MIPLARIGRARKRAAAGQLVEVVSVQPPKLFFDGFGMETLEGACREYPSCDLLYDLPEPDTSE